ISRRETAPIAPIRTSREPKRAPSTTADPSQPARSPRSAPTRAGVPRTDPSWGRIHHMRRLSEDGIRALRDARKRAPMGAQKVQRLHPWAEPKTMAEPGGQRVPTFKIGAKGFLGRRDECQASVETSSWRDEHEACRRERLAGRSAVFPHGTYGMRVFHGAEVAAPKADAIVAQPGPLLHEVMAEFEQCQADGARDAERAQVLEQVRAAWSAEASEITAADELDFASAVAPRTTEVNSTSLSEPADEEPRPEPEVRHRFHREHDDG